MLWSYSDLMGLRIVSWLRQPKPSNDGLVKNYTMLDVPEEVAAIVKTKAVVVAVEALGHDPIRAVGALLLELPGLARRVRPNVFRLNYARRRPEDAWVMNNSTRPLPEAELVIISPIAGRDG